MSVPISSVQRRAPEDVDVIQAAIKEAQNVQADLDLQIERLMRQVRSLHYQKSQQQERITYYKGLITLASRLPHEILARIFEMSARDGWTRGPLVLSHVCSAWRTASQYPNVWSHVYVTCNNRDPVERIRFWLNRAKQAPLYITLEVGVDGSHLDPIMDVLLDRPDQWISLTINSLLLHQTNFILSRLRRPLPYLKSVNININLETREAADPAVIDGDLIGLHEAFEEAPNLTMIHLSHELSARRNIIPTSITSLDLCLPFWSGPATLLEDVVVSALRDLKQLHQFTLEFPPHHERTFTPSTEGNGPLEIPTLESLTLKLSPEANRILTCISAPRLTELYLRSSCDPLGFPHVSTGSSLVQFLETSTPPLEVLELHDIDIPSTDISQILIGLPTLLELRLHESEITDDVIHIMSGPPYACPNLQKLDMRWCEQLTGSSLVELVRNRSSPLGIGGNADLRFPPVKEVAVINCSFVREEDIWDLARLTTCRVITRPVPEEDYCRKSSV